MKKLLPLLFLFGFISAQAQQKRSLTPIPRMVADANYRVGCSLFTDPANYTTGSSFSYNAPVNNNSFLVGPGGANYGCLYSVPNQAWFIITVDTPGNLYFNLYDTFGYDIDAAIWGPITNNDMANACAATQSSPLTCDYDPYRADLYINNAQAGQRYVMLVTNYSNASTTINIPQPTGGSVTYAMVNLPNCSLIPTATISGTSTTINEGQPTNLTLNFTGSSPWNYALSDGTLGTAYSSPLNLTVYPTASQTYTISSVSNLCGTNSGSGSVGISVNRNPILKSCFPLDGNATDSNGSNHGTLHNGVLNTTNRSNVANKALQFDGVNDYVSISTSQLSNNTFAFATWIKLDELPTSSNTEQVVFSLGGGDDEHYLGVEYYNGAPSWKFSSNNSAVYAISIVDTDWHLLTGVRTGGVLKLFVDGMLSGTTSVSGTSTYSNPLNGRIGGSLAGNKFFKGKIDDIKIFNSSLIDPEILLLQNYTTCNNVSQDPYIFVQSVSTSVICTNSAFVVRAFTNGLVPEPGTPFVVELSDAGGSFSNPTIIGSSDFLPVTATVPNSVAGGSYKIRLRYSADISINTFDIFVNKVSTYTITGATINDGQSTNLTLNFTGTGPWNYVLSNGLSGIATTSPWQIPVTPDQTTTYSVVSAQNVCGNSNSGGNSSASITVNFAKQNVSCFPFNGNANDERSINTTTLNGPILIENRYGQVNSAYAFNGASNYIEYTTNLLRKREYTMSAWVLANNISGGTQYILSQGETGTSTFQGLALTNSGWQFISYTGDGAYTTTSATSWTANQWVHLTAVRTYQQLKLYVNGNLVSMANNSSNIPFKTSDIGRIGASSSSLGNYFNGKIDDVRLFKGALNDEEVYALYANTGNCPTIENSSIILVKSLSPTSLCAGSTVNVTYTASSISPTVGSPFKVQLSDQNGSFANPTVIGSGISSPISAIVPINSPNSSLYRIRIVSSGGSPVTSLTTATLSVNGTIPTATISGGGSIPYGGSSSITINFTGAGPWTYSVNNQTSQTTSTNPLAIQVLPTSTTVYTVTGISNSCGSGTSSGSATVTVAPNIIMGSIASSFCQGQTFNVPFTANYTPTPNFRVELSDASGSFTNPVTIGTGTSTPVSVTIPGDIAYGTGYKIRIVSNSPAYTSANSSAFTVNVKPTATISGGATINSGQTVNLTINFTGLAPWTYKINNGTSQTTSTNPLTVAVSPTITTTYTITSLSNNCGSGTTNGSATITVTNDPFLISCYPFNGNVNDSHGNNHGTASSVTYTNDRFNNPNSALSLSGLTNSYAEIPLDELINTSAYTFSIWYNSAEYTSFEGTNIFAIMPDPSEMIFNSYGKSQSVTLRNQYFTLEETGAYFGTVCTNNIQCFSPFGTAYDYISLNTWYHLTVTRENNVVKLYRNGSLLNTISVIADNSNIGDLKGYIGKAFWEIGLGYSFKGKIDDLKIYRKALNATQVLALYIQSNCDDVLNTKFITLNSTSTSLCKGSSLSISYFGYGVTTPVKVQLSDANGNFTSPLELASGSSSPITVQIPANQATGANYRIRLVSSDNVPVVSNISAPLSITELSTVTISGTKTIQGGESANLTLTFTGGGPWTYAMNGGTSQTANTSPATVSVSPGVTTTYTVTSLSNACGSGMASGSAVITVNNDPYLISCYSFSGNVNDGKGNNHGVPSGVTYTADRFNNPNGAVYFNGQAGNSIEIPLDELPNTTAYTLSLWFSTADYASIEGVNLLTLMPTPTASLSTYINKLQAIALRDYYLKGILPIPIYGSYCSTEAYGCYKAFGPETDSTKANKWYHLVVTRLNNVVKLYRDGELLYTFNVVTGNAGLGNLKGFIGKDLSLAEVGKAFKGKLDDIQIYRRALSLGQIQALYRNSNACFDASQFTCLTEITFDSILGGQQTLTSKGKITGVSTIQTGSNIYFDAKNAILLQPGFKTEPNTIFTAKPGNGCVD